MTMAFLLLDIPRMRTGIEKVPYWLVYGIKTLARIKNPRRESTQTIAKDRDYRRKHLHRRRDDSPDDLPRG